MKNPQSVKTFHKNYHKVSHGSYVDSTLFAGFPKINKNNNQIIEHSNLTVESKKASKTTPNFIFKSPSVSLQRSEVNAERGYGPLILTHPDVHRLAEEKNEMSNEAGIQHIKDCLKQKQKQIDDMVECRESWKRLQEKKDCRDGATDLACQHQHKMNLLKENYCSGKLDREDEVKMMQTLLNRAVTTEVWDKQSKEKKEAMNAWKREDRRMDGEMENMRKQSLGTEEEVKAHKKVDMMKGLVEQINEKKLKALEEEEEKFLEGRKMRECWAERNEADLKRIMETGSGTKVYKADLDACMLDKTFHKLKRDELDKRMMAQIEEVRQELERKVQLNKGDRSTRIQQQMRVSEMLRHRQEENLAATTQAEEKRLKRAMDQLERDKRRKEEIERSMRSDWERRTKQARDKQVAMKREAEAIQAAKDSLFFESNLRKLISDQEHDDSREGARWKRLEYGAMLRQQMCVQEGVRKEEMCGRYKERLCMQQQKEHRNSLVLQHADKHLAKHKCDVRAAELLRISDKVKSMVENPK